MALNSSGPISLLGTVPGQSIQLELGSTGPISLLDNNVRLLAGISSGPIGLFSLYGKSSQFVFNQIIASDTANYNLRSSAIAAGWDQIQPLNATITINSGVYVYSTSTGLAAFSTGSSFPAGSSLKLINNGYIYGRGGNGGGSVANNGQWGSGGGGGQSFGSAGAGGTSIGNSGTAGSLTGAGSGGASAIQLVSPDTYPGGTTASGSSGGPAMSLDAPLTITNNNIIGGGGGGGGAGMVQAAIVRVGGTFQNPVYALRVVANAGGNGGTIGSAGASGAGTTNIGAGGAAGSAVVGSSNVTWANLGTIYGAIV